MELLQELFLTALIAVFFSFLIAKLVSFATGAGDSPCDSHVPKSPNVVDQDVVGVSTEDSQYRERLQVETFKSEKRVEFVEQGAELVDKFFEGPVEIEEVEKSVKSDEVIGAECCEQPRESIEDVSKEDKKLLEDISGNNSEESQENIEFGEKYGDDKSAIEQPEEIADEKERGFDEDLPVENIKFGTEFSGEKDVIEQSEENRAVESEATEKADKKKIEMDSDDDDWEGIERSELENMFAKAAKFVQSGNKDEDLQMQLYGLHKVATEGPCHEQPPMALKVAARAKWNAWQRLGNMSPEVAMEQYIALVSDKVPGWMEDKSTGDGKPGSSEAANIGITASDISNSSSHNPNFREERNEVTPSSEKNDLTGGPILESRAKE